MAKYIPQKPPQFSTSHINETPIPFSKHCLHTSTKKIPSFPFYPHPNRQFSKGSAGKVETMKIPARFERVAAAFEESSGSEHSSSGAESATDLSDLVKSFMERDYYDFEGGDECEEVVERESDGGEWPAPAALGRLFGDRESERIRRKIELPCRSVIGEKPSSLGFKRKLMNCLRETGIDSGLCKTKWKKFGQFPAGEYEYVDVKVNENRYIVEVYLVGEFGIARPTSQYASLLKAFPQIYVGKAEELKKIVKVMGRAMRESMKSKEMHIPPWRKIGYMEAKWFGSYKRTTNEVPTKRPLLILEAQIMPFKVIKSVGFEPNLALKTNYHCRGEFGRRNNNNNGLKVGHLSAAFDGQGIGI